MERRNQRPDFWPVAAGNIGNLLEWYDFVVFAFLAPVIGARFFPSADALSGLINAFGVFAVGYLMRPIGGILFGHLGDRLGRKRALQLSMVVMAIPTVLMAALPTHTEVGVIVASPRATRSLRPRGRPRRRRPRSCSTTARSRWRQPPRSQRDRDATPDTGVF